MTKPMDRVRFIQRGYKNKFVRMRAEIEMLNDLLDRANKELEQKEYHLQTVESMLLQVEAQLRDVNRIVNERWSF